MEGRYGAGSESIFPDGRISQGGTLRSYFSDSPVGHFHTKQYAEGAARHSRKEFIQFLHIASGSIAELETQLLLAARMGFVSSDNTLLRIQEVRRMLLGLLRSLKKKPVTHHSSPITSL